MLCMCAPCGQLSGLYVVQSVGALRVCTCSTYTCAPCMHLSRLHPLTFGEAPAGPAGSGAGVDLVTVVPTSGPGCDSLSSVCCRLRRAENNLKSVWKGVSKVTVDLGWWLLRTTKRLRAAASEARSVASTAPNMISRYSFPARLRNKDPIARKPPRFPPLSRYQPLRNPVFLRWADRWRSPDGVLQQLLCRNPKRRLRRRKSSTSHPGRTTATTSASWRISTSRSTSTIWCAHGHTSTPHACTCICVCTVECTTGKSVTLLPSVGICLYSWREGGMPISTCTTWRFVLLPRTQTVVRGALTHKHMDRRMVGRMSYGPQIDTLADTCQQAGV